MDKSGGTGGTITSISPLFDLSLDIERHQKDSDFARKGGIIHYVFDENVFELFVFPSDNWRKARRYSGLKTGENAMTKRARVITGKQAALLTSETLFAGRLPGQREGRIYLTEWHRWELLDRMYEILGNYTENDLVKLRSAAQTLLGKKFETWQDSPTNEYDGEFTSDDITLPDDIQILRENPDFDRSSLVTFVRSREATILLAKDTIMEPAQQVSRLLDPNMQRRLKGLVSIRRPTGSNLEYVKDRARTWTTELRSELRAQHVRHRNRRFRNPKSIKNDGQSLALIEWIAQSLDPNKEQLVFVTGDSTLFDAYRRLFDSDDQRARPRPFILRRPIQYSPIFHNEIQSQFASGHMNSLYAVQPAIELALISVHLAPKPGTATPEEMLYKRHSLSLLDRGTKNLSKVSQLDSFWQSERTEEKVQRIVSADEDLEFAERMLIGLSRNTILRRMSEEEIVVFEKAAKSVGIEQERLFSNHAEDLIRKLPIGAIDVMKPIAEKFFDVTMREGSVQYSGRVPMALRLQVSKDDKSVSLIRLLDSIRRPPDAAPNASQAMAGVENPASFLKSVIEIFVASCAVALFTQQWRLADHFSAMAIKAFVHLDSHDPNKEKHAAEAYYLASLAKRFRIGQLEIAPDKVGFYVAQRLFREADQALNDSRKLSGVTQPLTAGDLSQCFPNFRVSSEKAALHLFLTNVYHSQAAFEKIDEERAKLEALAKGAHQEASVSLRHCLEVQMGFDASSFSLTSEDEAIRSVKTQFLINIAAWHTIGVILHKESFLRGHAGLSQECIGNLPDLNKLLNDRDNPLRLAYILAFKIIQDIEIDRSMSELEELANAGTKYIELALDKRMLKFILSEWVKLNV